MTLDSCGEDCGHWPPRCTYPDCYHNLASDQGFYPSSTRSSPGGADSMSALHPDPPVTHDRGSNTPHNKEQAP